MPNQCLSQGRVNRAAALVAEMNCHFNVSARQLALQPPRRLEAGHHTLSFNSVQDASSTGRVVLLWAVSLPVIVVTVESVMPVQICIQVQERMTAGLCVRGMAAAAASLRGIAPKTAAAARDPRSNRVGPGPKAYLTTPRPKMQPRPPHARPNLRCTPQIHFFTNQLVHPCTVRDS